MKRFQCPTCAHEVHFESQSCVVCGQRLGILPTDMRMVAHGPFAAQDGVAPCANAETVGCNWMAAQGAQFCMACQYNRTVPDLSVAGNRAKWAALELAKRKLIYALNAWRLPRPIRGMDHDRGLAFDFLADQRNLDGSVDRIGTGHLNGVITLNLGEGDEVERIARKRDLREPYRTVIGHLRHEIGHYYWMQLGQSWTYLSEFRAVFGDESRDYGAALEHYYATGPIRGWQQSFISAYASAHPWEDFAETWSHWMHIVDGLETAQAYGITTRGSLPPAGAGTPYLTDDITPWVDRWVELSVAINSMNRGMGQPDLYPFVLSQQVIEKMTFINRFIQSSALYSTDNARKIGADLEK